MTFNDLLAYTEESFDSLRKPNGHHYEGKTGPRRSLIQALSSNGIFLKTMVPDEMRKGLPNSNEVHYRVD